ncbi:hypothetical protein GCM10020256_60520 [Streptomyces thermocoprophilus]
MTFVGAGPGAADLLTFRAARAIAEADIVIWAASLVQAEVLEHAREGAEILDSATMSLEDVVAVYERAHAEGLRVARVHSGDPALWGGTQEQLDRCREIGVATEVVPGVSSFSAVAALAQRELTIPEVAQSVILTRLGGGKTPMPPGEEVREFARHGTTMAVFLSAARSGQLVRELLEGGYPTSTPVVVAYQATWPEELVVRCTVGTLEETVKEHRLWKHTLFLVGPALDAHGTRSHLYHPGHFHGYRKADPKARRALRERGGEHMITVVGTGTGAAVPPQVPAGTALVVGGRRHLDAVRLPEGAETVVLGPLAPALDAVERRLDKGERVVVLASGDPGFFGIVRVLAERFGPGRLDVRPGGVVGGDGVRAARAGLGRRGGGERARAGLPDRGEPVPGASEGGGADGSRCGAGRAGRRPGGVRADAGRRLGARVGRGACGAGDAGGGGGP